MSGQQHLRPTMVATHSVLSFGLFFAAALWVSIIEAAEEVEKLGKSSAWSHYRQLEWPGLHPSCGAWRQSPINIQTNDVVVDNERQLNLMNYNKTVQVKIKTSKDSLSVNPNTAQKPSIWPNWLFNEYELTEVHFHWGDGSPKPIGSEHIINSLGGVAEMHLVHLKKGLSIENIAGVNDAIVVIGVILKLGPITNREVANFVAEAESTGGEESNGWIDGLLSLLPPINQRSFYTYAGSLTTPPCQEVVNWIVMHSPISISQEKLTRLASLTYLENNQAHKIGQTYRMVQPLNQRIVYMSNNITQS